MHGQKAGLHMHWTAYHLVCVVNGLSGVPIKATRKKESRNKVSQSFFMLALTFLVSLIGEITLLVYFIKLFGQLSRPMGCLFGKLVQPLCCSAGCKPFSQLPSRLASFQTVRPGF